MDTSGKDDRFVDWNRLARGLEAYARARLRRITWPQLHPDPSDVAQNVFLKALEAQKTLDPSEEESQWYFRTGINNYIVDLFRSAARNRTHLSLDEFSDEGTNARNADRIQHESMTYAGTSHAPDQTGSSRDHSAEDLYEALLKRLEVAGDAELIEIICAVTAIMPDEDDLGHWVKPQEIASRLGVPVKDIYNRLKRLRRIEREVVGERKLLGSLKSAKMKRDRER